MCGCIIFMLLLIYVGKILKMLISIVVIIMIRIVRSVCILFFVGDRV